MIIFSMILCLFVGVITAMVKKTRLTATEKIATGVISIILADVFFLFAYFGVGLNTISYVEDPRVPGVVMFPLLPIFLMISAYEIALRILKK
ncbi:MAG TPA: hypothetical protein VIU12_18175 [Chryseolinea sp.]